LAIEDFLRASALIPKHLWTYIELGHCYDSTGQFDKSIVAYSKAIKMDPYATKIYQFRANAYDRVGRKDLADKDRQFASSRSRGLDLDLFPSK
jgi:tetratricopeptide (TPR) repeat protein